MKETRKQYLERRIKESATEYGVTRKDEPEQFRHWETVFAAEHFDLCYAAAGQGVSLSRYVLDSLTPYQRYRIFHDFPDNRHGGYILPEARQRLATQLRPCPERVWAS